MKMIMTYLTACMLGLITVGCSTLGIGGKDGEKMVEIPDNKAKHIPEWFLQKPSADSGDIFVTATDVSKDFQFAIDKATLNAKIQLAERLGTKVDSLTRESAFENGVGAKNVQREVDRVSKVRVSQELNMFTREHIAVVKEGDHYRAFVMLKISKDDGYRLSDKKSSKNREEKLKELDVSPVSDSGITTTPGSQVDRSKMISNSIKDEAVKARIAKTLDDPNSVVLSATIR